MSDAERVVFVGEQRRSEEEVEYGPDVPLGTRLRLELEHLHS